MTFVPVPGYRDDKTGAFLEPAELGSQRKVGEVRLDELPQLWNVLRGEMSLVGPRPWPPEMVRRQVAAGRDYRNRILAGLTGPAQVTKGEGIPFEDLDSRYLERCGTLSSWALVRYDLQILWRTVVVIARGEGLNY